MRDASDEEELTPEWLVKNTKLIHYLLRRRGITEDWYPEYEDKVQDILCNILRYIPKYDPTRATKAGYIDLLITAELGRDMGVNKVSNKGRHANQHLSIQDADMFLPTLEEDISTQVYAEQEYNKLTEVQQMEALGYTFKEIGAKVGLSPDYLRNSKGLSSRSKT